jgi:geranylgeranyl diphosphate synthase type II
MLLESIEGQAIELGWIRDNHCTISDEDYLRLVLKKTCWYTTIHPCRIGALIASDGAIDPDRFNRFGYFLGSSFQIQDDILNLVGDERRYGKEIGGDIREGKRTLMLAHLLRSVTESEAKRLRRFLALGRDERTDEDLVWVRDRMDHYGSIDYSRSWARDLAAAAYPAFEQAYGDMPDSSDRQFIEQVIGFMVERDL